MVTQASIGKRIWDEFAQPRSARRKKWRRKREKRLSDSPVEEEASGKPADFFSPFIPSHMEAARAVYTDIQALAASADSELEGISLVLDHVKSLKAKEHPDLLDFVVQTFLIHDVHQYRFQLPSILLREPKTFFLAGPSLPKPSEGTRDVNDETQLSWFRQDALLNDHHLHWHIVYSKLIIMDRHGEMFFYMHRQMLARYDAERLATGMRPVSAYDDFSKPISTPHNGILGNSVIANNRPAGAKIPDSDAELQHSMLAIIQKDIGAGKYDPADPLDMQAEIEAMTRMGSVIENDGKSRSSTDDIGYHNNGHQVIANLNDGVMRDPTFSIMDPIFWEWHKGIDDIYESQIRRLPKHRQFLDAPAVKLRKAADEQGKPSSIDIILCLKSGIAGYAKAAGAAIGQSAFGNSTWMQNFEKGSFIYMNGAGTPCKIDTTNSLTTMMKRGNISYIINGRVSTVPSIYLNHEPFCYFVRVENTSAMQTGVTVRTFIVPAVAEEQASSWIEMDKFSAELPPFSKTVLFRDDEELSVIRKPARLDPAVFETEFDESKATDNDAQCDCGWPYNLILPKGSSEGEGMPFHLLVMVTNGSIDLQGERPNCSSLSFCGARAKEYPDKRPLGYPFNRAFAGTGILDAIRTNRHMASRQIFIQHKEN